MAEIETQSVSVYKGAFLLHMGAKHAAQGFLEKMGGAVIFTGIASVFLIYLKRHLISDLQHPFYHASDMAHLAAEKLNGVLHLKFAVRAGNDSIVAALSAHGGVKRRLLHDNRARLAVGQCTDQLRFRGEHRNFRIII